MNYVRTAYRRLRRNRRYALINLFGLSAGIACFLLVFLYVENELRYDRYHTKADQIYRVVTRFGDFSFPRASGDGTIAETDPFLAPVLKREFPEVVEIVRLDPSGPSTIRYKDQAFSGINAHYADSTLFDLFSFDLLRGDPAAALARPNTAVLTESLARRIFGDEDPIGKRLTMYVGGEEEHFEVTGLCRDVPSRSHFTSDLLLSFSTAPRARSVESRGFFGFWTYVVLPPGYDAAALEQKMRPIAEETLGASVLASYSNEVWYELQPLRDIYFGAVWAPFQGDRTYLYLFSAVALLVLLLACANYVSLATADALRRSGEVGIRKAMGAHRPQLVRQFLAETLLVALAALALALLLVPLALPWFREVSGSGIELGALRGSLLPVAAVAVVLVVCAVAGAYPAAYLSSFGPAEALRGRVRGGLSGLQVRRGLLVVQFAASAALVFCVLVIGAQLGYMQAKKLGFDGEQVAVLPLSDAGAAAQAALLKQELSRLPGVERVSVTWSVPGGSFRGNRVFLGGYDSDDGQVKTQYNEADEDFLSTMGARIVAGRDFSAVIGSDRTGAVIINEAAVRAFGWASPAAAIGKPVDYFNGQGEVIGVVEDFHTESFHAAIEPLLLAITKPQLVAERENVDGAWRLITRERLPDSTKVLVRIRPGDIPATVSGIERTWARVAPGVPLHLSFLDEEMDQLYRRERETGEALGVFSLLAIGIACFGLFGMATYTVEQRRKEIGIRKVLGAGVTDVVLLVSRGFLALVAVALVVGLPVAYTLMQRWLENFAYRIDVGAGIAAAAAAIALACAALPVGIQAVRIALANPAESIRQE